MEDYATVVARLDASTAIAGYELNVSCPNVKAGGVEFGADPATHVALFPRNTTEGLNLIAFRLGLTRDDVVIEPDLEVPHPRFRERFFVLGPLAEIASDLVDPVTVLRVGELLRNLLRDESR